MSRGTRYWLGAGVTFAILAVAAGAVAPGSASAVLLMALIILWAVISSVALLWRLWRWLTYRVGIRLFLSYLLIGVSPFLFSALFGAIVLDMLMGQYTSVRFGSEMERRVMVLQNQGRRVLEALERSGFDSAEKELSALGSSGDRVLRGARLAGRAVVSDPTELPETTWITESTAGVVRFREQPYLLAVEADDASNLVVSLLPLDRATAAAISASTWYDAFFVPSDGGASALTLEAGGESAAVTIDDYSAPVTALWGEWSEEDRGVLSRPWVFWFRRAVEVRDLETGGPADDVVTLLRTSPANVWNDFVLSRYELSSGLQTALISSGTFFLVVYGLALALAAAMIVSITRSTARLTRGAREVAKGNLDHRIPVKRRDQLGDLAVSFNGMIASVQDMLRQVADRERLARELELAREIQESLLPDRHLQHGPLTVHGTFRPAAEVGGDYFDIFPLSEDRLVVVMGDVAGHGLHTGLLMASLKSSVAALIYEGYTGSQLIERVNRVMMEHSGGRTMATLTIAEIDPGSGKLRVTNAGHPPVYLLHEGSVRELLASALPLGSPLCVPAEIEAESPPGSLLVMYSDGLVEAVDASAEPFGYHRLARLLDECSGMGGGELSSAVLGALDRYVGDRELADDLTLVVVENGLGSADSDRHDSGY